MDPCLKPCMVVLNRGDNSQCIVGPNQIYYDASDGDEYKVCVPRDYLRQARHPLLKCAKPSVEIFAISSGNRNCKLANSMNEYEKQSDADQNVDPA